MELASQPDSPSPPVHPWDSSGSSATCLSLNGSLSERLKLCRQGLGISQRRLAEILGVDPGMPGAVGPGANLDGGWSLSKPFWLTCLGMPSNKQTAALA